MRLDERLRRLEEKTRLRNRPNIGPLVLVEGRDGNREEVLARCREEIAQYGRGPLVICFCDDKPEDPPMPGVIRFDKEDAALL